MMKTLILGGGSAAAVSNDAIEPIQPWEKLT
jgi:hypothetical protein